MALDRKNSVNITKHTQRHEEDLALTNMQQKLRLDANMSFTLEVGDSTPPIMTTLRIKTHRALDLSVWI